MSWYQLLDIIRRNAEELKFEPQRRRQACPLCGTPYEAGPAGQLFCRHDGYQPEDPGSSTTE